MSKQPSEGDKMKNQKGFTIVNGLLIVIALAFISAVGFYVYDANQGKKQESTTPNQTQVNPTAIQKDPTDGWKIYKDSGGLFEFKYPATWVLAPNLDLCSPNIVLLGANQESTGRCASDGIGQIIVEARKGDLLRSEYELRDTEYSDIKSDSVNVNGVAGLKQLGTFSPKEEVFLGPAAGDKKLIYIFQDQGYTYAATYHIPKNGMYPDVKTDFETMIEKTFKFKQ